MTIDSKDTNFLQNFLINIKGALMEINGPLVMGILNLTPDSFFDGGKYKNENDILQHVSKMLDEGASIIDIGAYSSRPGATDIHEKEEIDRLIPVLNTIVKKFPEIIISVDTFRSSVARAAADSGAVMINDISAGLLDAKMFQTVAESKLVYIMMHMKGNPSNMKEKATYEDVCKEVFKYFTSRLNLARQQGIRDIILDPGFGFAKDVDHNYLLLKNLKKFNQLNLPILVGVSRKSMLNKVAGTNPGSAIHPTVAANTIAVMNGAKILRVHDVKAAVEAIKIASYLQKL